jgi:cytochrome c551/c552
VVPGGAQRKARMRGLLLSTRSPSGFALLLLGTACAAAFAGAGVAAAAGDREAGRAVFTDKGCARCHVPRGSPGAGPALEDLQRPQGEMELAGRLWNHVPEMFAALAKDRSGWPRIAAGEMADLMAYLEAEPARDGQPDPFKGQLVLLRKGCLKCHSLAGEGGRVEPDLAEHRPDYESGAAWAAAMWTHTPAMAAMATRRAIPYPRFSGDEMGNLVGFLRHVATDAPPRRSGTAPGR